MVNFPNNKIPGRTLLPRKRVIEEARKLRGLPHIHLGRNPLAGVDCLGLLCCVADALGVSDSMPGYDYMSYKTFGFTPTHKPDSLVQLLEAPLVRINNEDKGLGDIEVYWIRRRTIPCHAAILTDKGHLHSIGPNKKVVEQPRSRFWDKRLVAVFRFPGIEV